MNGSFAGSQAYQEHARRTLAGGVATAFRAGQLPVPICFERGTGAYLTDVDSNRYVDFALGFGPLLLGHSPEPVLDAVRRQLDLVLGHGGCHRLEAELAEAVCRTVPSAELCVFNSTGSEAVQAAIRIARSATGRIKVVKFLGHYHGWFDNLHLGVPGQSGDEAGTGGQDPGAASSVVVIPWNDLNALASAVGDAAAVIMEPVSVNAGCLEPAPGYLEGVRRLTELAGAVLIFDEVITGYRLALGGAQERYGVTPDLTVLGKALGAGFPISAVCGRADVMAEAASFRVAHVGTFNLNPVCAAAALAAVGALERSAAEIYPRLDAMGAALAEAFRGATAAGLPLAVNQVGGTAHAFASAEPVSTYADTLAADHEAYHTFAAILLEEGVHVIPRGLLYVSTAHGETEMTAAAEAVSRAAARVTEEMVERR
jgi:glutamate-1-semialdehyde 2,1-aminomutase